MVLLTRMARSRLLNTLQITALGSPLTWSSQLLISLLLLVGRQLMLPLLQLTLHLLLSSSVMQLSLLTRRLLLKGKS